MTAATRTDTLRGDGVVPIIRRGLVLAALLLAPFASPVATAAEDAGRSGYDEGGFDPWTNFWDERDRAYPEPADPLVPLDGRNAPGSPRPVEVDPDAPRTAYRVGKIVTMDTEDRVINDGVVVVAGTVIEAVGRADEIEVPDDAEIVEMPGAWLVPGLVEAHNHTAGAMGDLHDYVYLTNPGLRTVDTIVPDGPQVELAQAGGVTSALLIPGSGTNMSGFGSIVKFRGTTVEDAILRNLGSIKIAQAGNPERYWWGVGRMFMNFNTRLTMEKALAYHRGWTAWEQGGRRGEAPILDPTWEGFRELFERRYVASVHTQAFQVVMTTVGMLADGLGVRTMLDHSTFDGWKTAPLVIERGDVITMNGPRQFHFDWTERTLHGNAARWWDRGVRKLGINTDAPVIPQQELTYQAAMACWYGWEPYAALRGVTIVAAEGLMIEDVTGSIAPGLDADFALWSGDPLDPRSTCWITVVDGAIVRDVRSTAGTGGGPDSQRWF